MVDPKEPNGSVSDIRDYRAKQTGWRVNALGPGVHENSRGLRVDLHDKMLRAGDKFWDKLFTAIDSGLHPISTLRSAPRRVKLGLVGTAAILVGNAGVQYYLNTPEHQTPQGVEELDVIGKNVDGRWGVEEARVNMYLGELEGVFSPEGADQLRQAALQTDSPPFLGGGSFEDTQRGLDAMIVISQVIEAHDLGDGRYLEFHDEELAQLEERLRDFVASGLASDKIEELNKSGDINGTISYLRNLGDQRRAALATLEGREIVEIAPTTNTASPEPGLGRN